MTAHIKESELYSWKYGSFELFEIVGIQGDNLVINMWLKEERSGLIRGSAGYKLIDHSGFLSQIEGGVAIRVAE